MELRLTPETETKLNNLALRTHRDASELLEQDVRDWLEERECPDAS